MGGVMSRNVPLTWNTLPLAACFLVPALGASCAAILGDIGQLTSGRSGSLVERADDDVGHPHRQGLEVEIAVRHEDAFSPRGVRCRDRSDDCRIAHCVVDSGAADTRSDTFSIREVT